MTDNEALKIAKKQLSQAIHLSECGVNDGIRAMYEDKAEWLCSLIGCIERQKAEIERLKRYDEERDIALHARLIANAKTEAIREFAEKVKSNCEWFFGYNISRNKLIDGIAKEMMEGEDNG